MMPIAAPVPAPMIPCLFVPEGARFGFSPSITDVLVEEGPIADGNALDGGPIADCDALDGGFDVVAARDNAGKEVNVLVLGSTKLELSGDVW